MKAQTNLALQLGFSPNPIEPAGNVRLIATIENRGSEVKDASLKFKYPNNLSTPKITSGNNFQCTVSRNRFYQTVKCTKGMIAANGTAEIILESLTPAIVNTSGMRLTAAATVLPGSVTTQTTLLIADSVKPDLAINGTLSATAVNINSPLNYDLKIVNIGPVDSVVTTMKAIFADGSEQSFNIDPLATNGTALITVSYTPAAAGAFVTSFSVDPANQIDEGNETNNNLSLKAEAVVGLPDLTVLSVNDPDNTVLNQEFIRTISLANNGEAGAVNIEFKDSFNGFNVGTITADQGFSCTVTNFRLKGAMKGPVSGVACSGGNLAAGAKAQVVLSLTPRYIGNYSDTAHVDYYNKIVESNENNNTLVNTITVN